MDFSKVIKSIPKPHQLSGAAYLLAHKYVILADDMGIGKSLQAIMCQRVVGKNCLVVCPSSLKYTWREEFRKHSKEMPDVYVIESHNDLCSNRWLFSEVVIVSYGLLDDRLFDWCRMLVADEGHALKNINAQRTKKFDLGLYETRQDYFFLLSGTPIKNRVEEFYQLISMASYCPAKTNGLDINEKFETLRDFNEQFCYFKMVKVPGGRKVRKYFGVKNIPELKSYLLGKYLRRDSSVLDLPELLNKSIYVDYSLEDPELAEAWEEHKKDKGKGIQAKVRSALRKAPFTASYVEDLMENGHGPLVVFTDHLDSLESMYGLLKGKFKVKRYRGATPLKERDRIVKNFQAGKLDVILATVGAGSVGLTLTKACNVIFNDIPWVPEDLRQAIKRIHRIGQKLRCMIHYIVGSYQDDYIIEMNKRKREIIKKVV